MEVQELKQRILRKYSDASDILYEIITIFLEETPQKVKALKDTTESSDMQDLKEAASIAHSLVNTIGALEAHETVNIARSIEVAARAGNSDTARDKLDELELSLVTVYNTLKDISKELSGPHV